MQKFDNKIVIWIVLVVILGFLGGVVGELWINGFLLPESHIKFQSYSDLSNKLNELIEGQEETMSLNERDIAINDSIQKVRPAIVKIYKYKNFIPDPTNSLLPSDLLGQAVIITNDGWILTSAEVVKSENNKFWVVTHDHQVLESEQVVINKKTNTAYLKIQANNLPVAEFKLKHDMVNGQSVFLFGENSGIYSTNIKSTGFSNLKNAGSFVRDSESFYKLMLLKDQVEEEFLASPVITLDGKVAGLLQSESGLVTPIDHLTEIMKEVVQGQEWQQPYLGIKFYDLAEVLNPQVSEVKGAKIVNQGIKSDSPAKGILQAGDIILKIENEELSANKNLTELISQYKPGNSIRFWVKRGEDEQEFEITLK